MLNQQSAIWKAAPVSYTHLDVYKRQEVEPDVVAVEWQHEGHILKAYFNHSKKEFVLERRQADLISHGTISDDRLIIQPNGFVIYRED